MDYKDHSDSVISGHKFHYSWVIVAACTLILTMQSGISNSFGVFFKPLIADFGWSRGITSGIFSTFMISLGFFSVLMGWLADRFGPSKVMVICSLIVGIGLILSSRIDMLWQLYITFGLLVGIGISGCFPITTGTTARWFRKYRGLALGIVSAGTGLGTLFIIPIAERLITGYGWSKTYFIFGLVISSVMVASAFFLKRNPEQNGYFTGGEEELPYEPDKYRKENNKHIIRKADISLKIAYRSTTLWLLFFTYLAFCICLQMVMIHLVNYATDIGISSLIAATLISVIGMGSIIGRIVMGIVSDRIGSNNAMIICCIILTASLIWLIFTGNVWMFYLFAIVFGFAYGGEIPQMPLLIGRYFGLNSVSALVGVILVGISIGGALGSWLGGYIFDVTSSYRIAYTLAAIVSAFPFMIMLMLRRVK